MLPNLFLVEERVMNKEQACADKYGCVRRQTEAAKVVVVVVIMCDVLLTTLLACSFVWCRIGEIEKLPEGFLRGVKSQGGNEFPETRTVSKK